MTCAEAEPLIGASLDGELDAAAALRIEEHLSSCAACASMLMRLEWLRDEIGGADLDWSAEADLRPLTAAIRRRTRPRLPWLWGAPVVAVAAALIVFFALPARRAPSLDREILDSHIRSLVAGHLVDVPSSDRHTVKPWFQGRVPFAPPVPDLTGRGFELVGGRLDVFGAKPAAALVYKRGGHVINVWLIPADGADRGIESSTLDGYHLLHWQKDRMSYWAASDLNEPELRDFANAL